MRKNPKNLHIAKNDFKDYTMSQYINLFYNINLTVNNEVLKLKESHDKKAFRRLLDVLLTLFDSHLSKRHIRLKAPLGEYG
jgi:hypothetical protein